MHEIMRPCAARNSRFAASTVTAVGAAVLGAVITIGPAAGLAQADAAAPACTGALIVVPGTGDPGADDMHQIWDRPDVADYEHILVEYPTTLWPLGAVGYNADVQYGYDAAITEIRGYRAGCPDAPIEIVGWSQGARIAGDVLSDIGNGRIDGVGPENVSGVLYSDPRQVGTVTGRGIELSMIGVLPGLTMTGARDGGFGEVSGSVISVCAQRDAICDLPDPLHDPIGVFDGLIGFFTRHTVYPEIMNTAIDQDVTTGTWLDEIECTDEGVYGTVCRHQPGSALSGVVRDTATSIGLPGDKLPDLLVLRPRVPGTILPGVDLAGAQRPVATIFALLPDLPNLTHHAGGHLPDLFAFTDVLEGVVTLDEDKFRAGTTALGESAVSIVRIPRNQVRHWYVLAAAAWAEREAARAALDAAAGPETTEDDKGRTTGSETSAPQTTASASSPAASPAPEPDRGTVDDRHDAPTAAVVSTENAPQTPAAPLPSPAPTTPSPAPSEQTPTSSAPAPEAGGTTDPAPTPDPSAGPTEPSATDGAPDEPSATDEASTDLG